MSLLVACLAVRLNMKWPDRWTQKSFTNPVDHFNLENKRTFEHRAYENLSYVSGDKFTHAFVYIGGEGPLEEGSVMRGSMFEVAKNLSNVAFFGLEHRFFGKTQPFAAEGNTVENLKYLSIEQALADLANYIQTDVIGHPRAAENVRIAVVGGSYPGSLSSWFRLKYPHLAHASWASSAPTLIKNDFIEYDEHVSAQVKAVSDQCHTSLWKALNRTHDVIASHDQTKILALKNEFGFYEDQNEISVLYVLVDVISAMVQYDTSYHTLARMCGNFTGDETKDWEAFKDGITSTLKVMGEEKIGDIDLLMATDTSVTSRHSDSRAWSYMTCTEVGWFQTASGKLRSPWINLSYFETVCNKLFGLTSLPNEKLMNERYGGINPGQTKAFFVNGGVDPWSTMSVKIADESLLRRAHTIEGASHCADLGSMSDKDSAALKEGKLMVIDQMVAWMQDWNCNGSCGEHGKCVINQCVCDENYMGAKCEIEATSKASFDYAIIIGVSIPVIAVVVIIFALWIFGYRRKEQSQPLLGNAYT